MHSCMLSTNEQGILYPYIILNLLSIVQYSKPFNIDKGFL